MCIDSIFGNNHAENVSTTQFNVTRQEAADREAAAKAEEAARQGRITAGQAGIDSAFSSFNDDYYNKYRSDYAGYYTPQIDEQYGSAKQGLAYSLASKGLSQSSIGAKLFGDLQKKYDDTKLSVSNQAQDGARALQGNVEKSKTDLYSLAQSASDPASISNRAAAQASTLTAPQSYTPLGDVFGAALGSAASSLSADQKSMTPQLSSPTIFGSASGSGRVVR